MSDSVLPATAESIWVNYVTTAVASSGGAGCNNAGTPGTGGASGSGMIVVTQG